jgi:hypothetical protein
MWRHDDLIMYRVATYSEAPWELTRARGAQNPVMTLVLSQGGTTYEDALRAIHEAYPRYEPDLASKFPLPPLED